MKQTTTLILLAWLVAGAGAQTERPALPVWTPEEILKLRQVGDVNVSPDGTRVLYTVSEAVMTREKSETLTHIHLARTDGTDAFPLTQGEKSCTAPRWSPDGKRITFLSARAGKNNLWLIRADGGEAEQLTDVKTGVTGYRWSPDGTRIAFLMPDPPTEAEERAPKEKTDVRVVGQDVKPIHLWLVPVKKNSAGKREPLPITSGSFSVGGGLRTGEGFDWSPDGKTIVFEKLPSARIDDWTRSDLATVDASGKVTPVANTGAAESRPLFSPDGKWIAYVVSDAPARWAFRTRTAIVPATGGSPRLLSSTYDAQPQLVGWSADGKHLYFTEVQGTVTRLSALPIEVGSPREIDAGKEVLGGVQLNATRTAFGFTLQTSHRPPEAFVARCGSFEPVKVSDVNAGLAKHPLGRTDVVRWKAKDGLEVEGLLTYPIGYEKGKRYPLLLVVHGGPAGVFQQTYLGTPLYPLASFAEAGYLILRGNCRGSSGYGPVFRFANVKDWGGGDYEDLMAGVDHAIGLGIADPDRLGVMGYSYGGYMTSWIITQTRRFKAASVGAGVTNLASFTGTADIPSFLPDYFGGEFWEDPETYRRHSPVHQSRGVTTPTLIQHGDRDERVPLSQGQELYNALKRQGVKVELVVYPRMAHGLPEPKLAIDFMQRNLDWFGRALKSEKPARGTAPTNGDWPSFRGLFAAGVADGTPLPTTWDVPTMTNVVWKTPIAGLGHSSPVIWGDRVFVTTAVSGDPKTPFKPGQYGAGTSVPDDSRHSWRLCCLERATGKMVWERIAHEGVPRVKRHLKASHANATPATDGKHIVALLGSEGLFCYNIEGKLLWKEDLGPLDAGAFDTPALQWGHASSPVIWQDLVLVQCDIQKDSFVAAYHIATGRPVWRRPRQELPSFSTPTVWVHANGVELVTSAPNYTRSYEVRTGQELWRLGGHSKITTPAPVAGHGLLFVSDGYSRPGPRPIFAIRPGASGDITPKEGAEAPGTIAWSHSRGGPYTPTPLVYGDYLHVLTNRGQLTTYEARTGRQIYQEDIDGKGGFSASLVAGDDKLYLTSEEGEVIVVRAGPKFDRLATNIIGEPCLATPALSRGLVVLRSQHFLWGITATK